MIIMKYIVYISQLTRVSHIFKQENNCVDHIVNNVFSLSNFTW